MSKKIPEHLKGFLNKEKNKPTPLVETYEYLRWDGGVTIKNLVKNSYEIAQEKGWWDEDRDIPHILSLIHSEVSEALEEYRDHGDNIFEFGGRSSENHGFVFELADIMIRVADLAGRYRLDLEGAIKDKTKYNASREHRHGGKSA